MLSLRVQHLECESLSSFLSRLSAANGVRPNIFCSHLSIAALRFIDGDPVEIEKVATLAGVDAAGLRRQAIVRCDDGFTLGAERLQRTSLRRDRLWVCPMCLQDDREAGRPPFGRTVWYVSHLRGCQNHQIELLELEAAPHTGSVHDVRGRLEPILHDLHNLSASAAVAAFSPFEGYLHGRLHSIAKDKPFLDSLELHAMARLCEHLGAAANHGVWAALRSFDIPTWRAAADAGFHIASAGEPGIRAFLTELQAKRATVGSGHDGAQAAFGTLYAWLSRDDVHPAFAPVRALLRQHIIETIPVTPGDVVLGKAVERRVIHSVRTAHLETGLHPKRLAKILATTQVVSSGRTSDGLKRFDAARGDKILSRFVGALSLKQAGIYIGADRVQIRLLHEGGFIRSLSQTAGKMAFAKSDLDAFLSALLSDAETLPEDEKCAASIQIAAKRANCSSMEIVQLVLDAKLRRRGVRSGEQGYASLLVDFQEVRGLVRGTPLEGLPRRAIISEMKTNYRVVDALIAHGVLKVERQVNPLNRCPVEVVSRAALNEFWATFGTLFELAPEANCHPRTLKSRFDAAGISPALVAEKFHASFYRRTDLPI